MFYGELYIYRTCLAVYDHVHDLRSRCTQTQLTQSVANHDYDICAYQDTVRMEGGDNRAAGDDSQTRAWDDYGAEVHTGKSVSRCVCSVMDIPGTKISAHSCESLYAEM